MCEISPILVAVVSEDLFVWSNGASGLEIEFPVPSVEGGVLPGFV
jgi:hypothetical protein